MFIRTACTLAFALGAVAATASAAEVLNEQGPAPTGSRVARQLIGTWKLVAIEERGADGKLTIPLDVGANPVGLLIYDATGHMSAHAVRRGRPRFESDDVHRITPQQAKTAFVGYNGYFGTYTVDERAGVVIHHVLGGSIPNWEGGDQRRRYTLAQDKLILEPPEIQAAGERRTRRLTWQRVRPG
jgi:hypothetical protein